MKIDRRIYFTTAIVALVVILAISLLARSDPLSATLQAPAAASPGDSHGIVMRAAQSTSTEAVEAIGVPVPLDLLVLQAAPTDAVRLARANPAL